MGPEENAVAWSASGPGNRVFTASSSTTLQYAIDSPSASHPVLPSGSVSVRARPLARGLR